LCDWSCSITRRLVKSRIVRVSKAHLRNVTTGIALAIGLFGFSALGLNGLFSSQQAIAATGINHQINFQGKIVNTDGTNVVNGTYAFTFKLYSVATAGAALWTETKSLSVTDGIFQTQLGDTTTLPGSVDFNTDSIYLGINFNPGSGYDGEMSPRIQFTAAAYAFNSEALGGISAAGFAQINPASAQAGSLNIGTTVQAGTSLQAPLVDTATAAGLNIGTTNATSVTIGRATSSNVVAIQGSASSTWAVTGASGTTTLSFTAPTGSNSIAFPNAGGTVCTTIASTCSSVYQTSGGSGGYIGKNINDTSSAAYAGTLLGFTNTSTGAAGVLSLTNAGSNAALSVTQSANPGVGQALIVANNTNGAPAGNLLTLQVGGAGRFSVDFAGNIIQAGGTTTTDTINGQTISSAASFTGTVTAATSLLAPLIDTPSGTTTLNIGTTNASSGINLNQNTTVVGTHTLTVGGLLTVGGINASNGGISNAGAIGGATTINATGLVTLTGNALLQPTLNSASALQVQNNNGVNVLAVDTSGRKVTLGNITATAGQAAAGNLVFADGTTDNFGSTLNTNVLTANRTLNLPDASGTLCTTLTCAAGTTGSYIQNATAQQASSNFNISGSGTAGVSFLTTLIDTPAAGGALAIGTTNATGGINLNQNITVAVGKSIATSNAAGTGLVFSSQVTGNTNPSFSISANGTLNFGGGTAATDSSLYRSGVGSLTTPNQLTTSGGLQVGAPGFIGKLTVQSGGISTITQVNKQFVGQTADLLQFQDANGNANGAINTTGNQLTLGRIASSGTVTAGALVVGDGTTDNFGATLNTSTLTAARTITLPNANGTVCLTTGNCNAAGGYIVNGTAQQSGNFNIQSVAAGSIGAIIQAASSATAPTLQLSLGTTPGAGSGYLTLRDGSGTLQAQIDPSANLSTASKLTAGSTTNGAAMINATDLTTGTISYAAKGIAGKTGDFIDFANASNYNVFQVSANGTIGSGPSTSASTGNVSIKSGDASVGSNLSSGSVAIDSGAHTGTGGSGSVLIGQTNAGAVLVGNATGQFTIQGVASASSIIASNGASSTTVGFATPGAIVNYNFGTAAAGTYTVCTTYASSCAATYQASGNYLGQNPVAAVTSSSSFTGSQYTFIQNSTGAATALALQDAGTNAAFSVSQSGNPVGGQAIILANNTNGAPSGNLIDLQTNAASKFSVAATGAITNTGTLNAQTISAAANFTGTITSANTVTVTTGGIAVTGASTITGSLGGITGLTVASGGASITGGANLNSSGITNTGSISGATTIAASTQVSAPIISSSDTTTGSTNSSAVAFRSGNATGTSSNSGNVNVDTGTATGTTGNVNVGTVNASNVAVGRTGATLALQGNASSALAIGNGTNTTTLNFANPSGNATYTLGTAATGSYNICTTAATSCSGTYLPQNPATVVSSTSNFVGTQYTFVQNNTGASSVLALQDSGTNSALSVTQSGNPSAGQALIQANNTNATPSGNLLDLQANSTSKFSVNAAGAVTSSGTINLQTISAAANFTGTVTTASAITVASGGISVTGNSSISGALGGITGLTVVSGGANLTNSGITNAGAIAGATTIAASTSLTTPIVDNTAGLVVGGTNATSVQIGHGTIVTSIQGSTVNVGTAGSSILKNYGATFDAVCSYSGVSGAKTLNTAGSTPDVCSVFNITDTGATAITVPAPAAGAGSIVYVSNMPASTTPFSLLGAQISVGSTATLVYNGTTWTYAGADASGLQTGYNNSAGGSTPEILLDNTRNGLDVQDANATIGANVPLLAVRASASASTLGSALISVTNTGVGINLGAANTVTGGGDLQFGGTTGRVIAVQDQATAATSGSSLTIKSAAGNTTGNGGQLNLIAGAGGSSTGGTGGVVNVTGGAGGGGNSTGGAVTVAGGAGTGTGTGGLVTIQGGSAAAVAGGAGGGLTLQAANGSPTGTGGVGGSVNFTAGDAAGTGNNAGGNILIAAGARTGTGVAGVVTIKNNSNSTTGFQVQNSTGASLLNIDSTTGTTSVSNTSAVDPYTAMIVNSGTTGYSGLRFGNLNSTTGGGANLTSYSDILGVDASGNVGLSNVAVSLTSPALAYWDGLVDPTVSNQSYPQATVQSLGGTAFTPVYASATGMQLTNTTGNETGDLNWSFAQVPFEEIQFQMQAGPNNTTGADGIWFYSYADGIPTTEYGGGGSFGKGYIMYFSEYHSCAGITYGPYTDGQQCTSGGGAAGKPLKAVALSNIANSTWHQVDIQILYNQVIVRWDGNVIMQYSDTYGRDTASQNFGFGSRTGGSNNNHYIKGLLVTKLGTNVSQYNIDTLHPLAAQSNANGNQNILTIDSGTAAAADGVIQVGSNNSASTQLTLLQLNSYNSYSDTATCATSTNQGTLYYNANTTAIRSCVNGGWEDLVTTSGLGLIAYGVLPDTGPTPGDLVGSNGITNSPCKVTRASATSVAIAACTVYSQGRKQIYTGSTLSGLTGTQWYHVCFSSPTSTAPVATANASETGGFTGTLAFSANNPVLCIADVQMNASSITKIYDTRVFTTSVKSFATVNSAEAIGTIVKQSATANQMVPTTTATDAGVIGVVVATSGVASATTPNAVIVTGGAVYVKTNGTSTASQFVTPSTTSGYSTSGTVLSTGAYGNLGVAQLTVAGSCTTQTTAASDCQTSQFMQIARQ
jgi:hypothetical protein